MIHLRQTIHDVSKALKDNNIKHALIGGLALGAYGVHRATKDVAFLVEGAKKDLVVSVLQKLGFTPYHLTVEVLQFEGAGRVDVLLANRPASLKMLKNATYEEKTLHVHIVKVEDLIGLKIQAYKNDQSRELQDKADIQALIEQNRSKLDLQLLRSYADLFSEWENIKSIGKIK